MILVDALFCAEGLYHGRYKGRARRVGAMNGHMWSHMLATGGRAELDAFAVRLGMDLTWRDGDHYDLTPGKRRLAVKLGAREITSQQMVDYLRARRDGRPLPNWAVEQAPLL